MIDSLWSLVFPMNRLYATLTMTFVEIKSNASSTTAPATGIIFPRLTIPVCLNLVTSKNPTTCLIFVRTALETFLLVPLLVYLPLSRRLLCAAW